MPARDPREQFVAEKSLRARRFARKHRGRGVAPWIAAVALVASIAVASSVPHMIAGSPLRGQLAAAGSAGGSQGFFTHLLCRLLSIGCPSVDEPVARDNAPPKQDAVAQPVSRTPISPAPAPSINPIGAGPPPPVADRTIAEQPSAQITRSEPVAYAPAQGRVLGASTEDIDAKIAELQRQIADIKSNPQTVFVPTFTGPAPTTPVSTQTFAQGQKIDQLSNTTIQSPTITGGSITAASIVGTISNAISSAIATIDALTSNTITATNVSFTNATTTNLATASFRISTLDCTGYGNGGTLTTDASGNVVCATDDGGSGGTVAGADSQVQFNSGGSFSAAASFTFASTTGKLAVPYASTTAFTALGTGYFGSTQISSSLTVNGTASTTNLMISGLPATLLSTDISGAAQSTTVSSPLSFGGSILSISQASSTALSLSTGLERLQYEVRDDIERLLDQPIR